MSLTNSKSTYKPADLSPEELAVMIDTFNPLYSTKDASFLEDENYQLSWLK